MNHRDCVFGEDACLTRKPRQPQQHRARGDLRQPTREPRRNTAAARPPRSRRSSDSALSANGVRPIFGCRPQPAYIPKTTRPRAGNAAGDDRGRPRSQKTRQVVQPASISSRQDRMQREKVLAATGGWKPGQQWLDLIANNARLPVLAAPGTFPNFASFFLVTRRLTDDWACGHQVVVAETFCDPERFAGARRRAGMRWARPRGLPAPTGAAPTPMARRFSLCRCGAAAAVAPAGAAGRRLPPRSPGFRGDAFAARRIGGDRGLPPRRKHTMCSRSRGACEHERLPRSCAVCAVAVPGRARGHRRNPRTELREPPSKATLHRVVQSIDPEALEDVLSRELGRALAADGKRIRGANGHHETVALTPPAHPSRC